MQNTNCLGKTKQFETMVAEIFAEWEKNLKKRLCGDASSSAVAESLAEHKKTEHKRNMSKARVQAMKVLQAKKSKRDIKLIV